ncbi:phage baseplate assembly protein V [Pseudomonas sp. zfem005]|uniref:phage baseplate assembly protein V n=1 Tax=Pseudomonas sp. zfem005 TaxID=3078200 RepID=UPI0029287759|nr:phage baseplate assembly protein V [Pseudomonas sp. zfem005]MDU9415225.1 phage baseplate assembly protein V [Pseudomonas sp. zfem005]
MSKLGFLARGTLALVNASRKLQSLQMRLMADEVKDGLEHFEAYGFTSNPQPGAEGLVAFINGDRSHGVVVCLADRRFRLQGLESGEVALYTDEGDRLHFKRGRVIEVETMTLRVTASEAVEFTTPVIRTTGRIESTGDQVAGGISQMQHIHGSVQPGPGQTSAPVGG